MSAQQNKDLIHEVIEVIFNSFELDRLEEYFTADFCNHDAPPEAPAGPAAFRAYLPMMQQAFPDRKLTPEFTLCDGDFVVSRTITEGHMLGELWGIPPTGKAYRITATDTYQVRDGKICARWGNEDSLGMMQQLGMIGGDWRTDP
jgi:predicted ester cyclase